MTHDPETAERLVAILTPLITAQSCGEWDDKTINEDVQMFLPPLLAALQEARNAALREAANIVRGEVYLKHYRTWVIWPPYDDLPQERPNVSENHGRARHCDQLADAILALIDTPAEPPPAPPAGDALREALADIARQKKTTELETEYDVECADFEGGYDMCIDVARAALAAAPAPIQPAPQPDEGWPDIPDTPEERAYRKGWNEGITAGKSFTVISDPAQPDADEREAMVYLIECTLQEHPAQHESAWHRAHYVSDVLLAAGWTRKREEG